MNIFAVHADPECAARALSDQHVVKMTVETAQILCTVAIRYGFHPPYRATHRHHPCVLWAGDRFANWWWVVRHGRALADEYRRRFGREHKSRRVIEWIVAQAAGPPRSTARRQPFAQCMPEIYRGPDAVEAYRRFYRAEKVARARWTLPARPPRWLSSRRNGSADWRTAASQPRRTRGSPGRRNRPSRRPRPRTASRS